MLRSVILHSTPCGRLIAEATQSLCGRLAVGWSIELGPRRGRACLEAARRGVRGSRCSPLTRGWCEEANQPTTLAIAYVVRDRLRSYKRI